MGKGSEIKVKEKVEEEKRVNKSVQKAKVHLTPVQVEARIQELEDKLEEIKNGDLPSNKKTRKRKLILASLIRLRRAQHNPAQFLKDPEVERQQIEARRQKKAAKKQKSFEKLKKKKEEQLKQKRIKKKTKCLCCLKWGHTAQECRDNKQKQLQDQPICYNCGSKDHRLAQCPTKGKNVTSLKFAQCFMCGEKGHIVAHCKQNPNGIYPKGGSCFLCGSNQHLAKECSKKTPFRRNKKPMSYK